MTSAILTRRQFIQLSALVLGNLTLRPWNYLFRPPEFPNTDLLGRVFNSGVVVKTRPDINSPDIAVLKQDDVVHWLREVTGKHPLWHHQRFVETPNGYVYAPYLQPVRNLPNQPLDSLPSIGGMWVEVSIPYVDLVLHNPPARSPWLKSTSSPRFYYSQIVWVDQVKKESGQTWYRVKEKYGTFGDVFWAQAEAFRPITASEISPIRPEVQDKRVEVNLANQTLSCYESDNEVFFCTISSGSKYDAYGNPVDQWATPLGKHTIWRKLISIHMTGGTAGGGYDLPGIGWTTLFSGNGVAIHSTFWHNSFGVPRSHGCVNVRPEDAKYIFRWTMPDVPFESGDITISGSGSTKVIVREN